MHAQKQIENYIAFDQISLFDIEVAQDSTRVTQYDYENYNLSATYMSYPSLDSFRKDHYIDKHETLINSDDIASKFELQIGQVFSMDSHSNLEFEVIPNSMIKVNYEYNAEVPDAVNGCSLRMKQIKTKNFSVYLLMDCEDSGSTSLMFEDGKGNLLIDAEELLWDLDSPRLHKASFITSKIDNLNSTTSFAGGLKVFEKNNKKGIFDNITQKVYLEPEYDEVQLKDIIVVKKNQSYGAFDYQLLPLLKIDNKLIMTSCNNRFYTTFIDNKNRIGIVNFYGNKNYKDELELDRSTQIYYDFEIVLIDNFFYLRKTNGKDLKNQYLSVLGDVSEYDNFYFNSKATNYFLGRSVFLFGFRADGLYDVFSFIQYHSPNGTTVYKLESGIDDYKLIPSYPNWSLTDNLPILRLGQNEFPLLEEKISKIKYRLISEYFSCLLYTSPSPRD